MSFKKIDGLIAAPFTPMNKDGSLNLDLIQPYYELLVRNGNTGAFIIGSTGEGQSLSLAEKKSVIEKWTAVSKGNENFAVIALLASNSLVDCKDLAVHAEASGIHGVAFTSPSYFKAGSAPILAACCREVAAACPHTAFYYYHIPVLSGCNIPVYDLLKAVGNTIPNFVGVKYTHEDFMDFLSCMNYENCRYNMLWGRDENLINSLVLGCRGGVGSTYNYAAPLYHDLIAAYDAGDFEKAKSLQQQSIDMIRLLGKYGGIATGKAFMKMIGLDCGAFRLPVSNMSEAQFEEFSKDVAAVGFHQYKSK